ncbi:MAG: glycosyltransferase family 39 protein [Nitrospirae bacterium]|nr:glycosyltransferase family 39 protein [Nitrospirota bacterium]
MTQVSDKHSAGPWSPAMLLMLAGAMGLLARAWTILHTARQGYAVDDLFDALAWNLVTLGAFTIDGTTPSAHVGPLYPSVLAVFYGVVGHRPEWVPYLHAACDVGASVCIFYVGKRLFGSWIGAITAAAMFLYPTYWTYDPRIRSESLLTLLMSAWLWVTVICLSSTRMVFFVGAGVLAGLVILCKPVTILLAVVLISLSFLGTDSFRVRMTRASLYLLACLLVVLPWTMRNYQAFGMVIPVSAGVGAGLWMGSDPLSRGSWPMPLTMESQIWDSAGITPLPYAHAMYDVSTDRLLRAKGWARITEAPSRYLWLTLTRAYDFWIGNSYYLINSDQGLMEGLTLDAADRGWLTATYSVAKRLLLIPGLIGLSLWSAWFHQSRWRELLPLYVFPIGLMLGYIPFTVEAGRYALPVLPCLMVLSVAVLAQTSLPMVSLRPREPLSTRP